MSVKPEDVKKPFLSLLPRECMSRYFLKTFCMYARPKPVQTKVYFKNLYFLAVYRGFKFCFRRCQNGSVFFLCLSNFLDLK